eukprot:TRINITY_DN27550_c0_g1_i1.p1 TRINITY_DN27550_c0_g1~~TRINITY_DN27550_c0_g1_i1.p1  ORF type:complete len:183 (-),score=39.14 TRINITY_DN27550_c0_g1_i1:410-958(-)
MADDPRSLNFMKLKKWMMTQQVPKPEMDACTGKDDLLRLAHSKGLLPPTDPPAPSPHPIPHPDPAPAASEPVGRAVESVKDRVKRLAMEAGQAKPASGGSDSHVKQMAMAANRTENQPLKSVRQRVKQMAGAMPLMMPGMVRPRPAPAESEELAQHVEIVHLSATKPIGPPGRKKPSRRHRF